MCEIIKFGDGSTAFVCYCGNKKNKDHECNSDESILILSNGERINDTPKNRKKHWHEVTGGSVACSICGRAAIDDAPYL